MSGLSILPSRIHAVTVHADGAVVRRRVELAGATAGLVRVEGLPLAIAGTPVRARVREGSAEVLSCRLVAVPAPPAAGDDRALERAVEDAEDAVEATERRAQAALARLRALSVLDPPARPDGAKGQPPPASPAAARFELLRFRDQQAERLGAELAAARAAVEAAEEAQAQAQDALDRATSARAARAGELRLAAELLLRLGEGAPGWVELEYTVPGACWAPSYVLRFDAGLGKVALALRALVAQRSGEDWSGVRIACATAALQSWCELPRLPSRRIGRAQPPPPTTWRPAPAGAEALFADWDAFAPRSVGGLPRPSPRPPPREPVLAGMAKDEAREEEYASNKVAECAAPPPPPAPACSAPAPKQDLARKRSAAPAKSASIGGPPGAMEKKKAMRQLVEDEADAEADDGFGGPPPGLDPGADLLDYAALRLAGGDESGRGKPRPGPLLAAEPRWQEAIASARGECTALAPAPPGHAPVSPARQAVRWEAPLPADVPADGGWHVVPLAQGEAEVRLTLVVAPREVRSAFRSAAFANPFDRALPAGPADAYVGADFLLTAALAAIPAGAGTDLGLGVEPALAVARNATFGEESAGLLGGSLHLRHRVAVSLHNKGRRAMAVEVRERLPQPDEQVEHCAVKELKSEPPWQPWEPPGERLPGGRRWRLELAAGAQTELSYEYRIEIPAKNELVGGNRREA